MSISKFRGRTTAGGANTQRQSAPQFRTQYSAYQRPDDNSPTYPVYNPGSHQTALREPSPEPPQSPEFPPSIKQEPLVLIFAGNNDAPPVIHLAIPQWNLFLLNHSLLPFATSNFPVPISFGPKALFEIGGSSKRYFVFPVGIAMNRLGFVVCHISQNAITPVNLIGSNTTGFEWLDDVYFPSDVTIDFNNPTYIKYNAERYKWSVVPHPALSSAFNVPSPTKMELEVDCSYPLQTNPSNYLNWRYFKYQQFPDTYDQKLVEVIRETRIRKFRTSINIPAYNMSVTYNYGGAEYYNKISLIS